MLLSHKLGPVPFFEGIRGEIIQFIDFLCFLSLLASEIFENDWETKISWEQKYIQIKK